jgi:hypothetical protein
LFLVFGGGSDFPPPLDSSISPRLSADVWAVLDARRPFNEFHRARARLDELGPEVDLVLVSIAESPTVKPEVRGNALILLADRQSTMALPALQRALLYSENDRVRAAGVLGLNRLSSTSEIAMDLIRRAATTDRSRLVRLNALQSLDSRDVETMRAVLGRESDAEVRLVAIQLISLAESRGAPLAADRRGALRNASGGMEPQIVFRPALVDSLTEVEYGDLRVELPDGRDIPLAPSAQVVRRVVPAFFSHDRAAVVYEHSGEIRIVDVATRQVRTVGTGFAPRLIPFTHQFVYFRERPGARVETTAGTEIVYEVMRSGFGAVQSELIGELAARARPDLHGGEAPVRWMVVGESPDGFVLRGEGVDTFPLPTPVWGPGRVVPPSPGQSRLNPFRSLSR